MFLNFSQEERVLDVYRVDYIVLWSTVVELRLAVNHGEVELGAVTG